MQLNDKGQESTGFRLLVEAVMVVFILVIIFAVLSKMDEITQQASVKRLFDGFTKAVDSPDGDVIFEKNIVLRQGSVYSRTAFAATATGIEPGCISIEAGKSSAFLLKGGTAIEITTLISTDVYYRCETKYESSGCKIECTISFGQELEKA